MGESVCMRRGCRGLEANSSTGKLRDASGKEIPSSEFFSSESSDIGRKGRMMLRILNEMG